MPHNRWIFNNVRGIEPFSSLQILYMCNRNKYLYKQQIKKKTQALFFKFREYAVVAAMGSSSHGAGLIMVLEL